MSNSRKKLQEVPVGTGIEACYHLIQELAAQQQLATDVGIPDQEEGQMNHVTIGIKPKNAIRGIEMPFGQPDLGDIELLRLTADRTLMQAFVEESPPPYLVIFGHSSKETEADIIRVYEEAPGLIDSIWDQITTRFGSLGLL